MARSDARERVWRALLREYLRTESTHTALTVAASAGVSETTARRHLDALAWRGVSKDGPARLMVNRVDGWRCAARYAPSRYALAYLLKRAVGFDPLDIPVPLRRGHCQHCGRMRHDSRGYGRCGSVAGRCPR